MDGSEPVLRVYHDMEDDGWQFLGRRGVRMEDAMVITLHEVVSRDASLCELADLSPGWHAWRKSAHEPWTRAANPSTYEQSV
jgi:hypothetical protein